MKPLEETTPTPIFPNAGYFASADREEQTIWPAAPSRPDLERKKRNNYSLYLQSIIQKRETALNVPVEVFLEISNACNFSCQFCPILIPKSRPTAIMSQDIVKTVLPWRNELTAIFPYGFGEPFLNRNLLDVCGMAVDHGMHVEFFSNGSLLTEKRARSIVQKKLPGLTISISTADPEQYGFLYSPGHLSKLSKNLNFLKEEKERNGTDLPRISFNAIVMRSTLQNLAELVKFAGEHGVKTVHFKPLSIFEKLLSMHGERIHYDPERDDTHLKRIREMGRKYNVEVGLEPYLATQNKETHSPENFQGGGQDTLTLKEPCPIIYRTMYVSANGEVRPCCFAMNDSLGDVTKQTLAEIWNGESYRKMRRAHLEGRVPPQCTYCVKYNLAPVDDPTVTWLSLNGFPTYPSQQLAAALSAVEESLKTANALCSLSLSTSSTPENTMAVFRHMLTVVQAFTTAEKLVLNCSAGFPPLSAAVEPTARLKNHLVNVSKNVLLIAAKETPLRAQAVLREDLFGLADSWNNLVVLIAQMLSLRCDTPKC
jgi:radical SAM protein with 4Fe4S-binding SPASM domain